MKKLFLSLLFIFFSTLTFAEEQLIIEPDAGRTPLLNAIEKAHSSIDLVVYGLTDNQLIDALIHAKQSGKNVHILLEPHPYKAEDENNFATQQFKAAHLDLHWANPAFKLTHQKTFIVDQHTAIIMTFNLTHSTFKNERNFALVIDDPALTQEIEKVFLADEQHKNIQVSHPNLIWSPNNSREKIIEFIKSARSDIKIYAQDLTDYQTIGALAKKARAGVNVKILVSSKVDLTSKKFEYLRKAGINIQSCKHLFIHAKVIMIDHRQAILGSINLTRASMNDNRELSIMTSNPKTLNALEKTFNHDWQGAPSTALTDAQKVHIAKLILRELKQVAKNLLNAT